MANTSRAHGEQASEGIDPTHLEQTSDERSDEQKQPDHTAPPASTPQSALTCKWDEAYERCFGGQLAFSFGDDNQNNEVTEPSTFQSGVFDWGAITSTEQNVTVDTTNSTSETCTCTGNCAIEVYKQRITAIYQQSSDCNKLTKILQNMEAHASDIVWMHALYVRICLQYGHTPQAMIDAQQQQQQQSQQIMQNTDSDEKQTSTAELDTKQDTNGVWNAWRDVRVQASTDNTSNKKWNFGSSTPTHDTSNCNQFETTKQAMLAEMMNMIECKQQHVMSLNQEIRTLTNKMAALRDCSNMAQLIQSMILDRESAGATIGGVQTRVLPKTVADDACNVNHEDTHIGTASHPFVPFQEQSKSGTRTCIYQHIAVQEGKFDPKSSDELRFEDRYILNRDQVPDPDTFAHRQQRYLKVYKTRMERIYREYNPTELDAIDDLLKENAQDAGMVHDVYVTACEKYELLPCNIYEGCVREAVPAHNEKERASSFT